MNQSPKGTQVLGQDFKVLSGPSLPLLPQPLCLPRGPSFPQGWAPLTNVPMLFFLHLCLLFPRTEIQLQVLRRKNTVIWPSLDACILTRGLRRQNGCLNLRGTAYAGDSEGTWWYFSRRWKLELTKFIKDILQRLLDPFFCYVFSTVAGTTGAVYHGCSRLEKYTLICEIADMIFQSFHPSTLHWYPWMPKEWVKIYIYIYI